MTNDKWQGVREFVSRLFPFLVDYEFESLDGGNRSYARIECRNFCPVPGGELRQIEIGYLLWPLSFWKSPCRSVIVDSHDRTTIPDYRLVIIR